MTDKFAHGFQRESAFELNLQDMLNDPIVRMLMERDGVVEHDVISLMRRIGHRTSHDRWNDAA